MKFSVKNSILVLIGVTLFTVVCFISMFSLKFDYDFEKFYPEDDPATQFFEDYRKTFSSDNDFLLIGLRNEKGVFEKDFLLEVREMVNELDTIENIDTVISLTRMKKIVFGHKVPYIDYNRLDSLHNDSIWIARSPDIYGNFISEDFKSMSLYLKHKDYLTTEGCYKMAAAMNRIKSAYEFDEIHIAGRAVGQPYYVGLMQKELGFFTSVSLVLLLVFLIIAFRSWWGVVIPLIVVVFTVIWILGIMAMLGKPINLVLTVLPTIMFVVGMSDVIHIVSKYLEELRKGIPKLIALRTTVKEVGLATLLTSITTSVGFLTLYTSNVIPIQDFGIYVAFGVMIAFVLAFLVLPAFFVLLPAPGVSRHKAESTFWTRNLKRSFRWTIRNQWKIGGISLLILALSLMGLFKLEVNNFLLEDLQEDDPMNSSFIYFDKHFSGVRPLEIAVNSTADEILSIKNIRSLDSLEQIATSLYPNKSFLSVITLVRSINRSLEGGANMHYKVPESEKQLKKIIRKLRKQYEKGNLSQFLSGDGMQARMSTTVPDYGGNAYRALHEQFFEQINGRFPELKVAQTGTAYLIDKNTQYLATSMMWSLAIAFAVIAVIVGLLYRSVKMVLISLVPNIFPLLMIAGIMGMLGLDIKVSTSILFTIAFGIAVDDTIHFISKLKLELGKGRSMIFAVRRTYLSTGRAIVLTTGILCSGFLTLMFSDFLGTFYMGLLITMALIFALISDLFLLPVLVLNFYGGRSTSNQLKDL